MDDGLQPSLLEPNNRENLMEELLDRASNSTSAGIR
jgi:hypothetical protein